MIALLDDKMLRADLATKGLDALSQHFSPEKCYGPLISEIYNSDLPPCPEAEHGISDAWPSRLRANTDSATMSP